MSLFDPVAPPNVTKTTTTAAQAPQYLTDYLKNLAQAGTGALGTVSEAGTLTPYGSDKLVADLPQNLTDLYANAPTTLARYETPMDEALKALQSGATGVSSADIKTFYDPYQQDVINEMARQSSQNVQQNMLPALKAAFAGQGAFGSRRYAGALGQAMGDVQQDLLGQQAKLRSEGFKTALDAALKERGYDIQAGQGLGGLGAAEATAGATSAKALGDIGTQELTYEQAKIDSPLTRAQNVAQILRGYTYPTTETKTYVGPADSYGTSALGQIAGLGSLLQSGFNSPSGWGSKLFSGVGQKIEETLYPAGNPLQTGEYSDPGFWT